MRSATFRRRLELLKKWRMNVVPLDEVVKTLPEDRQADHSVVLTLDDGWYSTLKAAEILKEFGLPSTVYVSTYYAKKQVAVFNVLLRYLFWKSGKDDSVECMRIMEEAIPLDLAAQARLLKATAKRLGIDPGPVENTRMFHFMTDDEMRSLREFGMDVQLHTHRHRFPMDQAQATAEISDNRKALEAVRPGPYVHFCFPSGIFQDSQLPWLAAAGIRSATTTRSGFNSPRTSLLKLDRFLDGDRLGELEFEAEICGVFELFRARR
jgi:peptidoglycan/xylan/chitin deacetylase (PgdA/CDA1 family)